MNYNLVLLLLNGPVSERKLSQWVCIEALREGLRKSYKCEGEYDSIWCKQKLNN